jgi:hypothetical protein
MMARGGGGGWCQRLVVGALALVCFLEVRRYAGDRANARRTVDTLRSESAILAKELQLAQLQLVESRAQHE